MEGEEEALRSYCRRMISHIHRKQPIETSGWEERRETQRTQSRREEEVGVARSRPTELKATGRTVGVKDKPGDHRHRDLPFSEPGERYEGERDTTSSFAELMSQGPCALTVPPLLISLLKRKAFDEQMRLAAEAELHDPSACRDCEQKQASLALSAFIRRTMTQLEAPALADRLNTRRVCDSPYRTAGSASWGDLYGTYPSPPMPLAGFGRNC